MPIVIAGDNHVAREEQALDLIEEHAERVMLGTPSKLVVQMHNAHAVVQATEVLKNHRFEVEHHVLGSTHYLHITL